MSSYESIQSVTDGISSNGDAPHWIEKKHLESPLFCFVCYWIYCNIISYVYAYRHRVVIQVCNIIWIYLVHIHTCQIHLFCFSVCGFGRWLLLLVFAITVCPAVWWVVQTTAAFFKLDSFAKAFELFEQMKEYKLTVEPLAQWLFLVPLKGGS